MSAPPAHGAGLLGRLADWQLFALCVAVWGTTWHVITWQVRGSAPELAGAITGVTVTMLPAQPRAKVARTQKASRGTKNRQSVLAT